MTWSVFKSISSQSRGWWVACWRGHHAPPFLSTRTLHIITKKTKTRREKRNKLLALVICLFYIFILVSISCDGRLIVTGVITNQNSWRSSLPNSSYLFLLVDGRQSGSALCTRFIKTFWSFRRVEQHKKCGLLRWLHFRDLSQMKIAPSQPKLEKE